MPPLTPFLNQQIKKKIFKDIFKKTKIKITWGGVGPLQRKKKKKKFFLENSQK